MDRDPGIIIDISYYQPAWSPERLKAVGGDAVIVKSTMGYGRDSKLADHARAVNSAGLSLGLYHWLDPTGSIANQVRLLSMAIDEFHPEHVWVDVEQCWSSWSAYWNYIGKKITWSEVPKYSDKSITDFARSFMRALETKYPALYIGIYTGKWFTDSYAPSLPTVMRDYPTWIAQYNSAYRGRVTDAQLAEIVRHASERNPVLPRGCTDYALWQITSSIVVGDLISTVEGASYDDKPVDLNITRLPKDDFFAQVRAEEVEPPAPAVRSGVVTARSSLRVRAEPNTTSEIIGLLPYNTGVVYYDSPGEWLKLADRDGWVYGRYVRTLG